MSANASGPRLPRIVILSAGGAAFRANGVEGSAVALLPQQDISYAVINSPRGMQFSKLPTISQPNAVEQISRSGV